MKHLIVLLSAAEFRELLKSPNTEFLHTDPWMNRGYFQTVKVKWEGENYLARFRMCFQGGVELDDFVMLDAAELRIVETWRRCVRSVVK